MGPPLAAWVGLNSRLEEGGGVQILLSGPEHRFPEGPAARCGRYGPGESCQGPGFYQPPHAVRRMVPKVPGQFPAAAWISCVASVKPVPLSEPPFPLPLSTVPSSFFLKGFHVAAVRRGVPILSPSPGTRQMLNKSISSPSVF